MRPLSASAGREFSLMNPRFERRYHNPIRTRNDRWRLGAILLAALAVSGGLGEGANAQNIRTDGTLGTTTTLTGANYAITPGLGRQLGTNLFHSFGQFNLANGETATFSGPGTTRNVI